MRNDPDGSSTNSVGMASRYDHREVLHQRGFRGVDPRRVCWPLQMNGDELFVGVGPDVGDAVGEIKSARRSEECPGQLLAAVAAEFGARGVDLQVGLRAP